MKALGCEQGQPREPWGEKQPKSRPNLHEDLETGLLALLGLDKFQCDGLIGAEVSSDLLDLLLGQAVELGAQKDVGSETYSPGPPRCHRGSPRTPSSPGSGSQSKWHWGTVQVSVTVGSLLHSVQKPPGPSVYS